MMRTIKTPAASPLAAVALLAIGFVVACTNTGADRVLGLSGSGHVSGAAYFDGNGTRELDTGDAVMAGIGIALVAAGSRDTVDRVVSDGGGLFVFEDVPIGDYRLVVDTATVGDTAIVARIDTADVQVLQDDSLEVTVAISFPILTIGEARASALGSRMFIDGIALNPPSVFGDSTIHLADTSGTLRAIRSGPTTLASGDSIRVRGTLATRTGQLVLNLDRRVPQVLAVAELPPPDTLTTAAAASAAAGTFDAGFVHIDSARVTDTTTVGDDFTVTVDDGSGPLTLLLDGDAALPPDQFLIPGVDVEITGVLVPTDQGVWQLKPRFQMDLDVNPPVLPIAEVRTVPTGEIVFVDGVALNAVAAFGDSTLHIADTSGFLRGISVRADDVLAGDSVRLVGRVGILGGQVTLERPSAFRLAITAMPVAQGVTSDEAATAGGGSLDAALVEVLGTTIVDTATVDGDVIVTVDDGSGPVDIVLDEDASLPVDRFLIPGAELDVVGVLVATVNGDWIIKPRIPADIDVTIPLLPMAEARLEPPGEIVFVDGIALHGVTVFGDSVLHVADTSGAIRSVRVRASNVFEGDSIRLVGRLAMRDGEVVIEDPSTFRLGLSTVPPPRIVPSGDAATARAGELDAALVRVVAAPVVDTVSVGGEFTADIDDGSGVVTIVFDRDAPFVTTGVVVGTTVTVTGVLMPDGSGRWFIKPRRNGDLTVQ